MKLVIRTDFTENKNVRTNDVPLYMYRFDFRETKVSVTAPKADARTAWLPT